MTTSPGTLVDSLVAEVAYRRRRVLPFCHTAKLALLAPPEAGSDYKDRLDHGKAVAAKPFGQKILRCRNLAHRTKGFP